MGRPQYFLGIEIAQSKLVVLSQRKYVLDLIQKAGLLSYKHVCTLDVDTNLWDESGPLLEDVLVQETNR